MTIDASAGEHPDIEIRSANVEIKTIAVSGKKLTKSTYQQIPNETLLNDQGHLTGNPWGYVNLHGQCRHGEHIHVLWQKDTRLRRARIDLDPPFIPGELRSKAGSKVMTLAILDYVRGRETSWHPDRCTIQPSNINSYRPAMSISGVLAPVDVPDMAVRADADPAALPAYTAFVRLAQMTEPDPDEDWPRAAGATEIQQHNERERRLRDLLEEAAAKLANRVAEWGPAKEIHAAFVSEALAERERQQRYLKNLAYLRDEIPQLFIG